MLPKNYRLLKEKDFKEVYQKGGRAVSPILVLRYKKRKKEELANKNNSRFGVVVSNKVTKTISARNRLKRQLRSIIHQQIRNKQIMSGFDCIIIARATIRKSNYQQIEENIEKLFKLAKLS